MNEPKNDDVSSQKAFISDTPKGIEPDAHGQAALLLAESILHALVGAKVLSNDCALSVLRTTCEVKAEVATLAGESNQRMQESLGLLKAIFVSFAADSDEQYPELNC